MKMKEISSLIISKIGAFMNPKVRIKQLSFDDFLNLKKEEEDDLIVKNQRLIYKVLQDMNLYYKSDEYFDVGMLGLIDAVRTYSSSKGSLSHYIYVVVNNRIKNQLALEGKDLLTSQEAKKIYFDDLSLNEGKRVSESDYDLEENIIARNRLELIDKYLKENFSKKHRDIFKKYYGLGFNRQPLDELAVEYNYSSVASVKQLVIKIKKNLKTMLDDLK